MVDIDEGVDMAIGIFIVLILAANLLPTAFTQIFDADQTNWTTDVQTLWDLIPLMTAIALVLLFVFWARKSGRF